MTVDTRTPEEIAYDDLMSGKVYIKPEPIDIRAQIDAETDPAMRQRLILRAADQVLANFGANPEPVSLTDQFAAVMDDPTLSPVEIGQRCAELAIAARAYSQANRDTITPLGTLTNGVEVEGLHDVDGSPHCARIEFDGGHVYAGDDGVFSGICAGEDFELTLDQLQAFRRLFAGDMLEQFMAIAAAWDSGQPLPAA